MKTLKSFIFNTIKRKESSLFLLLIIAGVSIIGWLSGDTVLTAYSVNYIPIAPSNSVVLIILSTFLLLNLRSVNSRLFRSLGIIFTLLVAFYCFFIFLDFCFSFPWDLESVFVRNPEEFGPVLKGRMSPITAIMYIFTCVGILGISLNSTKTIKYIGGSFSLLVMFMSSTLLIGYLYKAPLLYGSKIIPVSLPSAICFLIFSITLLRVYGSQYWAYSFFGDNKVTRLLLKSFLPVVVLIVVFQGYLITNFSIHLKNPTLSAAIILLSIVTITSLILFRISAIIGTQLLTAERLLKESEEKFRSIMENSADAIFITDQKGEYIYTNKSALDILGYSPDEILGKTFADFSPPDKIEEYIEAFKKILTEGDKILIEIELLKKDGNYISTDLHAVLLPDGSVYGSCRDITERKKAEKALKESEKKLQQLNIDKDRFISILGHDLKSPFNSILGFSEVLSEEFHSLKNDEIQNIANNLYKSAKTTNNLLEDILLWARSQQGTIPFKPQILSLSDICLNIIDILNPVAFSKNITIYYLAGDKISVYADINLLKTIFLNLVSNAIKFTNNYGEININAEPDTEKVTISISDSGIGIAQEDIIKLFDISLILTSKGTSGETGTGLGLLLCKEFVEKHAGKIWVESEPGKGSNFKFTLPGLNSVRTPSNPSD